MNPYADWVERLGILGPILKFFGCFAATWAMMRIFGKRPAGETPRVAESAADTEILWHWDNHNQYTVSHLLDGGLCAFGRTGAGKTSSLKHIARQILEYGNSSMLFLCAKPGDSEEIKALVRAAGREADLLHFHRHSALRFNMLNWEAGRRGTGAGQATNITRFIMELRGAIFREQEAPSGESLQWIKQDERGIYHAVVLLLQALQAVTPNAIQQILLTAPQNGRDIQSPAWKEGYCNRILSSAYEKQKDDVQQHDYEQAAAYFLQEWPAMADRTRGSILTGIQSILSLMNSGVCRELFFSVTNVTPGLCLSERKIVLVDFPPDEFGDLGLVANMGLKMCWQKAILRRQATAETPIAVIWGDESSLWFAKNDVDFLSRCRQSRGALVYLSQSMHAYKAVLPGDKSEALVNSLLANFSHKLCFALGDYETAEWAADLCGKELQTLMGGGTQQPQLQAWQWHAPDVQQSASFNEQYEYIARPEMFLNGLRTGGRENNLCVDAILVRSGLPFNTGYNVLPVTFQQEA